jgi:hypothetical protein
MPRHIRSVPELSVQREGLVDELVKELGSPKKIGQPIIIEDPAAGGRVLIHVIWDEWEGCPREERTAVIHTAYERALGVDYPERIALAIGITVPEAVAMGMLPYWVTPMGRTRQSLSEEDVQAILDAGGSRMSTSRMPDVPWLPGVRCATLEDAEATLDHLQRTLPKLKWMIAQEVYSPDALSGQ